MEDCVRKAKIAYDFSRCAATVLTSVISKPHGERVVMDSGGKVLGTLPVECRGKSQ